MRSSFVELEGIRFNFGEGPDNGEPLVFLPGFSRYWQEYMPLLEAFEPHYHVLALSMRGHGLSQRAPPYTISSYIRDTAAFLETVVGPSAFGIGHSAGAWFGLAVANDRPETFRAFVSIDQPLDPEDHLIVHGTDTSVVEKRMFAMRAAVDADDLRVRLTDLPTADGRTWGDEMSAAELDNRARQLIEIDPEIFAPWADSLEGWIVVPELQRWPGRFTSPLLFLDGDPEAGSMLTSRAVHYNLARYPWAERISLPDHDHFMRLRDDPRRAVDEIRHFLDSSS